MIDGYTVLNLFALVITPLVGVIDSALPETSVAQAAAQLSISKTFIPNAIPNPQSTDIGAIVFEIVARNIGDETANNVTINDTFPPEYSSAGFGFQQASIAPKGSCAHTHGSQLIINCSVGTLAPGEAVVARIQVNVCGASISSVSNTATVFADRILSATSNVAAGSAPTSCPTPTPAVTPPPQPDPDPTPLTTPPPLPTIAATPIPREGEPAIICDPAEVGCSTVLPRLGIRFSAARNPVICSRTNPPERPCEPFQPTLGARYLNVPIGDIKPDIRPGECSTAEDRDTFPRLYEGIPAVEVTFCEVQQYPEGLVRQGPQPVKNVAPADTSDLEDGNSATINPKLVQGIACRGLPGDPWWSESCGCTCDEQCEGTDVPTCFDAELETCVPIVRHDINITSSEECEQDPQPDGHFDPIP